MHRTSTSFEQKIVSSFIPTNQDPAQTSLPSLANTPPCAPNGPENIPQQALSLEQNVLLFPCCEYFFQYTATSYFKMTEQRHYGAYFRSTSIGGKASRFAYIDKTDAITFQNFQLNTPEGAKKYAHTGTFRSPFEFEQYQTAFTAAHDTLIPENKSLVEFEHAQLYDEILHYKNDCCARVCQKFATSYPDFKDKVTVYHHNAYPCVMVSLKVIKEFSLKNRTEAEAWRPKAKAWNQLFIAYFIAIVNKIAEQDNIPIEIVHRAGFGYHLPTIDVTAESFRINIGLVPDIYLTVLAKGLSFLFIIVKWVLQQKPPTELLAEMNEKINSYKEKLPSWTETHCLEDILKLAGDKKKQPLIYQITRMHSYIDLLAQYVLQELDKKKGERNYAVPIFKLLALLNFKKGKNKGVGIEISNEMFTSATRRWPNDEDPAIKEDHKFWTLMERVFHSINAIHLFPQDRILKGLNAQLEQANQAFIIRAAVTEDILAENGIGSDSEYEGEYEGKPIWAKKFIVATGMMAINVAYYLARFYLKQHKNIKKYQTHHQYMYYEVKEIISLAATTPPELAARDTGKLLPILPLFDLNHCDTTAQEHISLEQFLEKQNPGKILPVIILDCTNTSTSRLIEAIKYTLDYGIELILLVSSGLKNEQNGSDDHPYGTVRIITGNQAVMDQLYASAKDCLKASRITSSGLRKIISSSLFDQQRNSILSQPLHQLPAMLHRARKAFKTHGHVPTNQIILGKINLKSLKQIQRYKKTVLSRLAKLSQSLKPTPEPSIQAIEDKILSSITEKKRQARFKVSLPSAKELSEAFNQEKTKQKIIDVFNQRHLRVNRTILDSILKDCTLVFDDVEINKRGFLATSLRNALAQQFEQMEKHLTVS
jgi:hypothetical protein